MKILIAEPHSNFILGHKNTHLSFSCAVSSACAGTLNGAIFNGGRMFTSITESFNVKFLYRRSL